GRPAPEPVRARPWERDGVGPPRERGGPTLLALDHGQVFSMASATSFEDLPSAKNFTISFQKEPAPTSAGMRSEASNRMTEFLSPSTLAASLSKSVARLLTSRPEFAETQPPPSVALAFAFAQVSEARNAWNAATSGASRNAATNSPPPRTGLSSAVLPGR